MKIVDKETFEIGIHKSYIWNWKPEWCEHNSTFHTMENGLEFKFLNIRSYFVVTTIQLFFLKFIFYIKIKPECISGDGPPRRYVPIEDTHLGLVDTPHGKWSDKKTIP